MTKGGHCLLSVPDVGLFVFQLRPYLPCVLPSLADHSRRRARFRPNHETLLEIGSAPPPCMPCRDPAFTMLCPQICFSPCRAHSGAAACVRLSERLASGGSAVNRAVLLRIFCALTRSLCTVVGGLLCVVLLPRARGSFLPRIGVASPWSRGSASRLCRVAGVELVQPSRPAVRLPALTAQALAVQTGMQRVDFFRCGCAFDSLFLVLGVVRLLMCLYVLFQKADSDKNQKLTGAKAEASTWRSAVVALLA